MGERGSQADFSLSVESGLKVWLVLSPAGCLGGGKMRTDKKNIKYFYVMRKMKTMLFKKANVR